MCWSKFAVASPALPPMVWSFSVSLLGHVGQRLGPDHLDNLCPGHRARPQPASQSVQGIPDTAQNLIGFKFRLLNDLLPRGPNEVGFNWARSQFTLNTRQMCCPS